MKTYPGMTVVTRFREVAEQFGERPAIRQDRTVTYRELDQRSDWFAAHLGSVAPGSTPVIGLSLESVPEALAAMLGVMKASRAYTLIEPGAPLPRKLAIAEEMALDLVISDSATGPWPGFSGQWIDSRALPIDPARVEISSTPAPSAACCIVQTSGTTGQPLGVEISHAALLHTINNYTTLAAITPEDRLTMLTSAAHFAAHTAIFGALLNGACLYPFDVRNAGLRAMADWLEKKRLTIYQSPPSLFRSLCQHLKPSRRFGAIRFLRLGGEPALASDLDLFRKHFPLEAVFVNALGISEAGGNVAYFRFDRNITVSGPVLPVGLPSTGQEVFLADIFGQPVSPGETGEIVVRSDFLATGYYRRPELTSQKFKSSGSGGRRELWTGDLGHFTAEGWLMHDGRKDDQVKIRGHRVDLMGLESILRSLPDVREATVLVVRKSGLGSELIAFVVPAEGNVTAESIRRQLNDLVLSPVSPRVLLLESLPLNPGGKMDRTHLLQLASRSIQSSSAPRSRLEREIAEIWKAALEVTEIGVYDNFFACGGDSLKALQVGAAIETRYQLIFSSAQFLDRPTIAQMGEYISAEQKHGPGRDWRRFLARERAERVVALRPYAESPQPPLFICPGGWGHERELLVFAAMLPHLPPHLPVYGLKQDFLANSAPVTKSVETMAKNFLQEIRKIVPSGPYHLLGECVAGIIILEVAHQLRQAAQPPEKIILLDPRLPKADPVINNDSEATSEKIRDYYRVLAAGPLRRCPQTVCIIGTEKPDHLLERLSSWKVFDLPRLEMIHVSGNHETYIREHGREVARAIADVISPRKGPGPEPAGFFPPTASLNPI